MRTATYVYCILKAERAPALVRVPPGMPSGSRPRAIAGPRGTWLIVSAVPIESYGSEAINAGLKHIEWVSQRALAHEAVVEFCARRADVIPMKLFTIFRDEARAAAHVGGTASLAPIFRKIAGCAEWSVRVNCAPADGSRTRMSPARLARRKDESGTAFLKRKKTQRDDARAGADAARRAVERMHARLARVAKANVRKEGDVAGTSLMLDAAFLVPRRKENAFQRELQRLSGAAAASGCDVVLSGPWPPYHFIAEV